MPTLYPKRRAALALHDAGHWVVPCNGKVATKKDWPNERVERAELAEALTNNRDLDIAIVLNHCDLMDVEHDNGHAGEATLLAMFGGEIPRTPSYKSPRGFHRLFLRPEGLPSKAKLEIDGIEFRIGNGKGALSIVPPSTGRSWLPGLSLDEVKPAPLPPHIVDRLCAPAPKRKATEPDAADGDKIAEGQRNDTLFQKACALRDAGLAEEEIAAALLPLNARLCDPPLPDDEVRAIAHSAAKANDKPKVGFLARLMGETELWHDENEDPFATLPVGEHLENWKIGKRVRQFRRWLSRRYYEATGELLSAEATGEIAAMLEGRAIFDGPQHKTWRRTAEHEGNIYIDLCDLEWRAIEIDAMGWRIVSDPPVKFLRAKAMTALPEPVAPRAGETLRSLLEPFLNLGPTGWPLVAGWLVAALRPRGPYPVLKLLGEQGAAKTTTARVLRSVVDPNAAPVRAEPRSTRDLMITAGNGWVICLDNLSSVQADLSDALCRLATGGGFATRTLYTDEDETIFDAQRPAILTSIEEVATRSDLLERSLIVELPVIDEGKRRAEKEFWAEFERLRPRILGALLDAVSCALRRLPEIEQRADQDLSRMADFEQWATAAEPSLGLQPGEFVEAYRANRAEAGFVALESSPVVSALLKLVRKEPEVKMTATDLLDKLKYVDYDATSRDRNWPKTPRMLSSILRRVAPNLRQVGVTVAFTKEGNEKLVLIDARKFANTQSSQASAPAPTPKAKKPKPGGLHESILRDAN